MMQNKKEQYDSLVFGEQIYYINLRVGQEAMHWFWGEI